MKTCTKCGAEKPLSEFYPDTRARRRPGSVSADCKACRRAHTTSKRKSPEGKAYRRAYDSTAKARQKRKDWYKTDSGRRSAKKAKLRRYGMSLDEFERRAEAQGGRCQVCGEIPPKLSCGPHVYYSSLVVDHDHLTGTPRSLVCNKCNVALGMLRDCPEIARKAAAYLEKHHALRPAA